jgi:four helix bundle protein
MRFEDWEAKVPAPIRDDAVWRVKAYRLSLFLSDLAWVDGAKFLKNVRTTDIADQLGRAVRKISASVAEGYSRGTGKGRATFYEYALGSTRESRDWYYKGRHVLKEKVTTHRIAVCSELIRLLISMTSQERRANRRLSPLPSRRPTAPLINTH